MAVVYCYRRLGVIDSPIGNGKYVKAIVDMYEERLVDDNLLEHIESIGDYFEAIADPFVLFVNLVDANAYRDVIHDLRMDGCSEKYLEELEKALKLVEGWKKEGFYKVEIEI